MLSINISETIWTVINFFLLLFVLKRFLFDPILKVMDAREAKINAGTEAAQKAQAALEEKEYTAKAGGVEADRSEEMLARADEAFNRMLALTNTLRTILIKRLVRNTPSNE